MRREALVPVGLGLAAGVALSLHPFTRSIDYPQALLLAPLASLFAVIHAARRTPAPGESLVRSWTRSLLAPALFCVAALATPAVASLSGDVCDPLTGLAFHATGPWASAAAAAAVGAALTATPLARGWRVTAGLLLVLLSPLVPLVEFFTGPSVRFHTTFFGLYHGAIYDEAVFVEAAYLWFRLWNALGIAALLLGIDALRGRLPRWALAPAGVAAVAWLALLVPALNPGFLITTGHLDQRLPPAATCEHFVIHARPGGPAERLANAACRDLEFRLTRQRDALGLTPSRTYHAYLYDSPHHKAALMGAGRTSIARPWQGQLHIVFSDVGTRVSAHELVHLYAAEASTGALGIPVRRGVLPVAGLIEGLAVALEPPRPLAPLHHWAAAMGRTIDTPSMASLMEPASFWSHAGGKVYTLAGSFVRWLLETRGGEAVTALYGGATFEETTGMSIGALEDEWKAAQDVLDVAPEILELSGFIYDRPSVFRKRCPYAVGRCNADALRRLRSEGPAAALPLFRRAVAYDPERLAGLGLLARVLATTGEADAARRVLTLVWAREDLSETERATLLLARTDILLLEGKGAAAGEELDTLPDPAALLWREALHQRTALSALSAADRKEIPGLLGLASRGERRAQITRLLDAPDRSLACLTLAGALRTPGPWDLGDADAARCLDAPIGADLRCSVAAAARWAAWVRGDADAALRWQEIVERDCADSIRFRADEALDWRLRLEWEQERRSAN
ncbi:MAG: tetratricopeptide repeat protein [Pseudomonadota bacterium]